MREMSIGDPLPGCEKVAIAGLGVSGMAARRLLRIFGKSLILSDTAKRDLETEDGERLIVGANDAGDADVVVLSPGIRPDAPFVRDCESAGKRCVAELELGFLATTLPVVAVSGTDGKTTVTSLISHIFNGCGKRNRACGNIGLPFCDAVTEDLDVHVVETSAFQLPFCPTFRAKVFAMTNIAEDHSEYFHGDARLYAQTKAKPLLMSGRDDFAILNASDPVIRSFAGTTKAQVIWYAESKRDAEFCEQRIYVDGEDMRIEVGALRRSVALSDYENLPGMHNRMNLMAAIGAGVAYGLDIEDILSSATTYRLLPHRIQRVAEVGGIAFIDDSKATNAHAAMACLDAMNEDIVLIAGGVDKGLRLKEWIDKIDEKVTTLIVIGELSDRLMAESAHIRSERLRARDMEEAVRMAYEAARRDGVRKAVLSPACSSYDMFKDYEERGRCFAEYARRLGNNG